MNAALHETMKDTFARGIDRAMKSGASGAKMSFSQSKSISCRFSAGRLKSTNSSRGLGYTINVIIDGRMGSASANNLNDFDDILARAIDMAAVGSIVHFAEYPAPQPFQPVKTYCMATEAITRDEMIDACQMINDGLVAHDGELYVEAGSSRSVSRSLLMTSGGVRHETTSTHWGLHGGGQQTEGTDMLHFGASRGWKELNDLWDPQYVIDRAIRDLTLADRIVPAPSGHLPLLLDPGIFGAFLSPVTDGINGRTVARGSSPLADKIGQTILDPVITITDNPHRDFSHSAASLDGDGMPTSRHTVVESGELKMFLYDLDAAAMVGAEPTGSSGCSLHGMEIAPGEKTHEELLASIDEGIYLKGMLGFGQGNIASGDFSANVSPGYLIKNGQIVGRIKDTMIAGNLLELMKQNVQLSSDYDEPGRTPWAIIDGVSVSSSAG